MSRHMRLLYKVGKELKPEEVEESVQKTVATRGARSAVTIQEKLRVILNKNLYVLFLSSSFVRGWFGWILHVPYSGMPRDLNYLSIVLAQRFFSPLFVSQSIGVSRTHRRRRTTSDIPSKKGHAVVSPDQSISQ
jgi:hypothetical protein